MKYLLFCFLFFTISCHKDHASEHETVVEIPDEAKDVKIPSAIWSSLEGVEQKSLAYTFVPMEVSFLQKNEGVLKEPSYKFNFPRGGGSLDLSNYMGSVSGSFYVKFKLPENLQHKDLKVFFISQTKKRKIGDEVLGAGCGVYFDISKKFNSNFIDEGFKVNTTRARQTTVLGGTFLFSVKLENQVFISQVTFEDSQNKHLFCEGQP